MSAFQRVFRACALLCAAFFVLAAAVAQPYAHPQPVYLPAGKVNVVRVASVASILRHFTAADLEMKPGDLIFAVDGIAVDSVERFNEVFEAKTTAATMRLDFIRDGVVHQAFGPLFRFERGIFKSDKPRWGGDLETAMVEFTEAMRKKPVVRLASAVKLSSVKNNAAAGVAGLQKHDMLLSVNGKTLGRVSTSDILVPLFPVGTPLHFVYLRDGKMMDGHAPLTVVKTGLTKSVLFGFSGESKMVLLESSDLPQEMPNGVTVEKPA